MFGLLEAGRQSHFIASNRLAAQGSDWRKKVFLKGGVEVGGSNY